MSTVPSLPITTCPDGAGSINTDGSGLAPVPSYVPRELCIGEFEITRGDCADPENNYQEEIAAENLNISGAPVNVFKLLGVHEQGRLIDLTGDGAPIGSGTPANAFDELAGAWAADELGMDVLLTPSFIGYDFGIRLTSYGQPENAPGVGSTQHITSFRIQQSSVAAQRATQVRVDRSNGGYRIDPLKVNYTGTGNGTFSPFKAGVGSRPGILMVTASSPTQFTVLFVTATGTSILGVAQLGQQFNAAEGSFTILPGTTAFAIGDTFSAPVELDWYRVDVVNLPNVPTPALIRIKQSAPARYWRIVPTSFAGVMVNEQWVVEKLELFDFQATRLDDIQDSLFMENRDRDYAKASIQLRVAYSPFDAASDLSKFGFQVADIYTFTTTYATMVQKLGRPIVVGDVLELPPELQYDHNLKPVRKFLEVNDVSWAAEGYTTGWKPIMYRFVAQQLIPSQEHRDILGTVDTQKYVVDDGSFFEGIEQIQTAPLTVTERNQEEAKQAVPEKGINVRELASGTNVHSAPGTYDGVGLYVEDGLPPDGQPYEEGYKLPDVAGLLDGAYYRLNYPPETKIASRLYKFSIVKNRWIFVETDRRAARSAHKPSQREIFDRTAVSPLTAKL